MVRVQTSVQRRMVSWGWQTVERFSHLVHRHQRQRTSLQCRQQATMLPSKSDGAFLVGQRHLYYELRWKKTTGATLDMIWRYEQLFYGQQFIPGNGGWGSRFFTRRRSP